MMIYLLRGRRQDTLFSAQRFVLKNLFIMGEEAYSLSEAPPSNFYSRSELFAGIVEEVRSLKNHERVWIADFSLNAYELDMATTPSAPDLIKISLTSFDLWVEQTAAPLVEARSIAS